MYACICNAKTEKDIHNVCERSKTKEQFAEEIKKMFPENSCMICYTDIIKMYEEERK